MLDPLGLSRQIGSTMREKIFIFGQDIEEVLADRRIMTETYFSCLCLDCGKKVPETASWFKQHEMMCRACFGHLNPEELENIRVTVIENIKRNTQIIDRLRDPCS